MLDNTITRTGYGWLKECVCCGVRFESTREDAKTCGATCRQRQRRNEKKRVREVKQYRETGESIRERFTAGNPGPGDVDALRKEYVRLRNFLSFHGLLSESGQVSSDDLKWSERE